jgi:hypothetical protein
MKQLQQPDGGVERPRQSATKDSTATSSLTSQHSDLSSGRTRAPELELEHDEPAAPGPVGVDPEKTGASASSTMMIKQDQDIVDWQGPDDPENPLKLSTLRKWTILMVLGSATLCVTCASVRPLSSCSS